MTPNSEAAGEEGDGTAGSKGKLPCESPTTLRFPLVLLPCAAAVVIEFALVVVARPQLEDSPAPPETGLVVRIGFLSCVVLPEYADGPVWFVVGLGATR
jgi:hypothetical protein